MAKRLLRPDAWAPIVIGMYGQWALLSVLTWAVLVPPSAFAQAPEDLARAQQAYEAGNRAEERGDCARAIARFQEAIAIVETPQLRMRAGRCKERTGKLVEALGDYQRAVVLAEGQPELLALANGHLSNLLPRVPKVTFEIAEPPPNELVITIDGEKIADVAGGRLADPGPHRVHASAPGHDPFDVELELSAGKTASVKIVLEKHPPPEGPPKPTRRPSSGPDPTPWILLSAAGVTLGAAIGLGVYSFQLKEDAVEMLDEARFEGCGVSGYQITCPGPEEDPRYVDLEDKKVEQNVMLGLSVGATIVTVGLAVTGITLMSTGADEPKIANLAPWVDPTGSGGAGVVAHGTF